ncbi:MAG: hypothetical protein M3071_10865 [Actinomycetota bacterium]|nr:hypothetical protein [Actinomycetota bacterium]
MRSGLGGGPELGGAPGGEHALRGGFAGGRELGEGVVDAGGGLVAVVEVAELGAGQSVGGVGDRCVDLCGELVGGGGVERPAG